jgi:hypothetical protein
MTARFRHLAALPLLLLALLPASSRAEVDFAREVWPILQKSCVKCHRAPYMEAGKEVKPKGGLVLESASGITKGGSDGSSVTADDPDKSSLYTRTILPPNHEDVMPPKGKGDPLTFKDTETIKNWILEGAKFGNWKGTGPVVAATQPGASAATQKKADPMSAGVGKASEDAIRTLQNAGAQVSAVSTDSPLLRVEWVSGAATVTDAILPKILALGENVGELSLAGSKISDESLKGIAKFPRLTWLNLANTGITDAGLEHLKPLANLTYLNLYGTGVGDTGISVLKSLRKLKAVHVWKTRVTKSAAEALQKSLPDARVQVD